jgi:hypothetical protein
MVQCSRADRMLATRRLLVVWWGTADASEANAATNAVVI